MLDEIDFKIVKELKKSPKITYNKLAKKLNISQQTIVKRIEKLEANNVIKTQLIINPDSFGYSSVVDVFIWTKEKDVGVIQNFCDLNYKNNVSYFSKHFNNERISLQARFKTLGEVTKFLEQIETIPIVTQIKSTLVSEIIFDTDSWMPKFNI